LGQRRSQHCTADDKKYGADIQAGPCGAFLAYDISYPVHGERCFYDPSTKSLVGFVVRSDTPAYCHGVAYNETSGETNADCAFASLDQNLQCQGLDASASDP
jgi:hypothetical protein